MSRFWDKVNKTESCWEWTANNVNGYGRIRHQGKMVLAHRLSWQMANGPIPTGMLVFHKCDNPS